MMQSFELWHKAAQDKDNWSDNQKDNLKMAIKTVSKCSSYELSSELMLAIQANK